MRFNDVVHIAVAEASTIVRTGLVSVLKHIPDLTDAEIFEITSKEGLHHCMESHVIDVLIINPQFDGWFDIEDFKKDNNVENTRFVSLICSVVSSSQIKEYDESINLFDDVETISGKITSLVKFDDEEENDQSTLSQREKEIVGCIVRGMTNKEIAEKLFISIHTVVTHRKNISRKLQIHSAAGLTIYAIVNKLVELSEVKMDV